MTYQDIYFTINALQEEDNGVASPEVEASPDVHYEPIVHVEAVAERTCEEDESELYSCRAKLYRLDRASKEWKERGTGEVRLLQNVIEQPHRIRLVMRREQTRKVCANHYIIAGMTLTPNVSSDRSWVYTAYGDVSDIGIEQLPGGETLAIRFMSKEKADEFKKHFDAARDHNTGVKTIDIKSKEDKKSEEIKESSKPEENQEAEKQKDDDKKEEPQKGDE